MDKNESIGFANNRFSFRESATDTTSLFLFYEHFMRMASPGSSELKNLTTVKMTSEMKLWSRMKFFVAYYDQNIVGTIACTYDDPIHGIPFEVGHDAPMDFSRIRKHGEIMDISLFSIVKQFSGARDILGGLFSCVILCAIGRNVVFLGTQSAANRIAMYKKIGFIPLTDKTVAKQGTG